MSHSWKGKNGTKITYNPDLSEIVVRGWCTLASVLDGAEEVHLDHDDAMDLLEFVADYVRGEKISILEQMGTEELLGLGGGE